MHGNIKPCHEKYSWAMICVSGHTMPSCLLRMVKTQPSCIAERIYTNNHKMFRPRNPPPPFPLRYQTNKTNYQKLYKGLGVQAACLRAREPFEVLCSQSGGWVVGLVVPGGGGRGDLHGSIQRGCLGGFLGLRASQGRRGWEQGGCRVSQHVEAVQPVLSKLVSQRTQVGISGVGSSTDLCRD